MTLALDLVAFHAGASQSLGHEKSLYGYGNSQLLVIVMFVNFAVSLMRLSLVVGLKSWEMEGLYLGVAAQTLALLTDPDLGSYEMYLLHSLKGNPLAWEDFPCQKHFADMLASCLDRGLGEMESDLEINSDPSYDLDLYSWDQTGQAFSGGS